MLAQFQWLPEQASSFAARVDAIYFFLIAMSGVFSVAIAGLIIYFGVKYRRGSPASRAGRKPLSMAVEITWIVVPLLIVLMLFALGGSIYLEETRGAPPAAMEINCVARQWMWKFQHPQGKGEINELHVPVGQPIRVRLISEDVIHSFYVPAFRVKQDLLPDRYTWVWFTP